MKVVKYKAYHLSLCDNETGTLWPDINREYIEWNRKLTEETLEYYRDSSRILVSRKTSLFVCSSLDNMREWYIKKFKNKNPFVYALELTGDLYWMDGKHYEDLFEFITNGIRNTQKEKQIVSNYWTEVRPDSSWPIIVEGLFNGVALITDKILHSTLMK